MENKIKMPLEGIKVIELATVVAAPTAGRMLCAYGAEVIKVETAIGDEQRRAGEFEMVVCEDYKNPLFTVHNSNKTFTAIDLKKPEGMEAFLKLLSGADVFIKNPGFDQPENAGGQRSHAEASGRRGRIADKRPGRVPGQAGAGL